MGLNPRNETWDEGEDLNLEFVRADGRWDRVYVQVKSSGQRFRAGEGDVWRVRLEANALARYCRAAHPVILVAVDIESGEVRWDDLATLSMSDTGASIPLPPDQRLTVEDADAFVRRLAALSDRMRTRVVPVQQALLEEELRLDALDPRLSVRITADSDGIQHHIRGNDDAPALSFLGDLSPEDAAQLDDHLRFGVPATVEFRRFAITGSPVFEEYGVSEKVFLQVFPPDESYEVALGWLDEQGRLGVAVEGVATTYRGQDGGEMRLTADDLPLWITLRADHAAAGPDLAPMRATLQFHFSKWSGHLYRALPWWDSVYAFWLALAKGRPLAIARREYGRYGVPMNLGTGRDTQEAAAAALAMLGPLPAVVEAARRLMLEARWQEGGIDAREQSRWGRVALLLAGHAVALQASRWRLGDKASHLVGAELPIMYKTDHIDLILMGASIGKLPVIWRLSGYSAHCGPDGCALMPTADSRLHVVFHDASWDSDEACIKGCENAIVGMDATN